MINIVGGTKQQRKYAFSMASYVCNKFNINPDIEIAFRRLTKDRCVGGCVNIDDNEYEIDIKRSLRMRDMLTTLAHEMVHVKQYELGQLNHDDESEYDYWDKPSEIEAHGREIGLFITWAQDNNHAHKKWTQV
jgi:hypothetical protein|tara:strand:- start:997 stop:1395 length:399 start_codon:yes stop_codon:yes gene_type:complete